MIEWLIIFFYPILLIVLTGILFLIPGAVLAKLFKWIKLDMSENHDYDEWDSDEEKK
jgi:hypothetical protein